MITLATFLLHVASAAPSGTGSPSLFTVLGIIGGIATVLSVIGVGVFGHRFIKDQNFAGQLAAKDAVIKTNQQSIESLELRTETLEIELRRVEQVANGHLGRIVELERKLAAAEARYEELKKFTAPEAVTRFEDMLTQQSRLITNFSAVLDSRTARFDELGVRLDEVVASLQRLEKRPRA